MRLKTFLKGMAATGALAVCATLAGAEDARHWSYDGEGGPAHWSELAADNSACGVGSQQSPIDIKDTIKAELPAISLDWKAAAGATVVNNGHTMQVNMPDGNLLKRGRSIYEMLQFHFHSPSEHRVEGKSYPMEVHFVHKNIETGALGVLGVFITEGAENDTFDDLSDQFPKEAGKEVVDIMIDPTKFLPKKLDYWAYAGSLTTPPCTEIVDWMVAKEPIEVGADDIAKFTALYNSNARPPVAPNRRFVLSSF